MNRCVIKLYLGSFCLAASCAALAQPFPAKPVTLVVAYAPAGLGDALARTIAERLTVSLKQPVLVENKL